MITQWIHESSDPDADIEGARAIARKLCRDSLAWAATLAVCTRALQPRPQDISCEEVAGHPQSAPRNQPIEQELFAEVLAYSLRLFEMRIQLGMVENPEDVVRRVRHECGVFVAKANSRRGKFYKRLSAPDPSRNSSRYTQLYPSLDPGQGESRLTREMFEQFCRCTGLGSDVLVGSGENLASLVFYIALHGVLSARSLPTREQVLRLLRAAQQCRTHVLRVISELLAAEPSVRLKIGTRPAPRAALPGPAVV